MHLERMQVEEGFLGNLDIRFTPGLNVLIGARGTGKTSVIELLRYCLGAPGVKPDTSKRSREHALSILGAGQVTTTLTLDGHSVTVSRTSSDAQPRTTADYIQPIIFSQTEIETVGLEAAGRLRIIDGFMPPRSFDDSREKQLVALIASLTTEALEMRRETEEIDSALAMRPSVTSDLKEVSAQEDTIAASSVTVEQKTSALQVLAQKISYLAVQESSFDRARSALSIWHERIFQAVSMPLTSDREAAAQLAPHTNKINEAGLYLQRAQNLVVELVSAISQQQNTITIEKLELESAARDARQNLDSIQAGAGLILRRGQELREKKARLDSMQALRESKKRVESAILEKRRDAFDELERLRDARFEQREKIVNRLNALLGPSIHLTIRRNGQQAAFASMLADKLKGSGVKYGDIALVIAENISPRSLLEAIENFDVLLLSEVAGIALDRTSKVLSHLKSTDLGSLGTIDLEDDISMQLLDGTAYKDISMLSTGQRCTVILPIVLAHTERVVIVDQPEDHIDNAFIASTLIRAVVNRKPLGQIIFSTHNPNIPVLGEASNVIHLSSDGKRGYVVARGALNESQVVDSISTVMEGGADAFSKRAEFYKQYSP